MADRFPATHFRHYSQPKLTDSSKKKTRRKFKVPFEHRNGADASSSLCDHVAAARGSFRAFVDSRIHEPSQWTSRNERDGPNRKRRKGRKRGRVVRWTQESLLKVRGIVMAAVGVLILLAYLISRL